MNTSPKPVLVRIPSKDSAGAARRLDLILYRVQFGPFTFNGPAYKAGMEVSFAGRALASTINEVGTVWPDGKKRVGRLVSGAVI
jgi:Zn-dependent M28 family amino/carboxypeptidase